MEAEPEQAAWLKAVCLPAGACLSRQPDAHLNKSSPCCHGRCVGPRPEAFPPDQAGQAASHIELAPSKRRPALQL